MVGGFSGENCLASAEVYSPQTDQWTAIESMTSPRSGVAVVTYLDELYALGGFDGERRQATGGYVK